MACFKRKYKCSLLMPIDVFATSIILLAVIEHLPWINDEMVDVWALASFEGLLYRCKISKALPL